MADNTALPDLPTSPSGVRIEHTVTSGTFSLDGGTWEVDNNVYVIGDDKECVVIDAPHDAEAILRLVNGRTVKAVLLTHSHDDHIDALPAVQEATGAAAYLHPEDKPLWDKTFPDRAPEQELADGDAIAVGDVELRVIHTPGHAPGACVFHVPALGVLLSGDTLFSGGPGATGRSFSSFDTIIESIRERILTLPEETVVLTGHGDATSVGAEKPHLQEWIDRGH